MFIHGTQRWTPSIFYSTFSHLSRQATIPEPVSDSGGESREILLNGEFAYNGQFGDNFLDAGVQVKRELLNTDRIAGGEKVLYTTEPYAQFTAVFGKLSLVPGIRFTYSDQWGTHVTPKLAALIHVTPAVALRMSVGAGYRAPDFKELYLLFLNSVSTGTYIVRGNPDLRPETSRNVTGDVEWTGPRSYARLQLFYNTFDQFIETALVGDSSGIAVYTYNNVDQGITRGVDVQGGVSWGRLDLDGAYEYLDAFQRHTHLSLLGTARHSGRLTADYRWPWQIKSTTTVMYTGRAPLTREANETIERDVYVRYDMRLARPVWRGIDVQIGAQNVFNTHPDGWPGPTDRQIYAGVTFGRSL
jgi:outer membrane receptor for ferrienterochelin and colicins